MIRELAITVAAAAALGAQPAEIAVLKTPAAPVSFLRAKNSGRAAAVCVDGKLRVWALPEGRISQTIDIGERRFDSMAISADGSWIAGGDHSGGYTVWNAATGARQMELSLPYYPFALEFSPDGKRLAIAPASQPVQLYDVASGKKLFQLQQVIGGTQAVAFARDGRRIATADSDTVVRVYDGANGELLARHTDFLMEPLATAFTADGKQVLAGGGDQFLALLDTASGRLVRKSEKLADPIAYLDVSSDGKLAAAVLLHAANMLMPAPILVSETSTGRKVQEWLPPGRLIGGGWTSEGNLTAAIAAKDGVHIWRIR